jgi:hypothetical protein
MKGKKYHVRLTEAEKNRLLDITKKGSHPARQIIRANILLQLDESGKTTTLPEQETIAEHCGCQVALVSRVGKQYEQEGIDRVLNRKLRESPPVAPIVTGRFPLLPQQLHRLFVHTNHQFLFIVGPMIHFKDIFHRRYKRRIPFRRDTPAFLQMRFIRVFFSMFPTAGADICSTIPNSTALVPNSHRVHRLQPSGGSPQHRAMIFASTSFL